VLTKLDRTLSSEEIPSKLEFLTRASERLDTLQNGRGQHPGDPHRPKGAPRQRDRPRSEGRAERRLEGNRSEPAGARSNGNIVLN
jgi:hypothetical protein